MIGHLSFTFPALFLIVFSHFPVLLWMDRGDYEPPSYNRLENIHPHQWRMKSREQPIGFSPLYVEASTFIPLRCGFYIIEVRLLYPFHLCHEASSPSSRSLSTKVMIPFHQGDEGIKVELLWYKSGTFIVSKYNLFMVSAERLRPSIRIKGGSIN